MSTLGVGILGWEVACLNVSEVMVAQLAQWGVDRVFGIPGDSIDPLVEALRRQRQVHFVQVRHEESGALMASAHAKLTGRLGCCLATAGPGALHMLNGLYDAKMDRAPVLALAGQVDTRVMGTDYFQEVNLNRVFDDVSSYCQLLVSPEQTAHLMSMAARAALSRRGVAMLTIPFDIGRHAVDRHAASSPAFYEKARTVPSGESLQAAADLIEQSQRPVILAGRGALSARAELLHLAEHLSAPIVHTLPAKGVIDEHHPLSLGGLGLLGAKPAHYATEHTDLLLMVGTSYPYLQFLPRAARTVQIDNDPEQIGKRHFVDVGLAGDAKVALSALQQRLTPRRPSDFVRDLRARRQTFWEHREAEGRSDRRPMRPQVVPWALSRLVEHNAIISVDVGNVLVFMARNFRTRHQHFLTSSWLGTMGFGLPGAIAAQLAEPDRQVVAVAGDGGFAMGMADLVTAVKYELPITVIVLNNRKLAMIKYEQELIGYPEWGVDLQNPDFAQFAQACGAQGLLVKDADDVPDAISDALRSRRTTLLDVWVEANELPRPPRIEPGQAAHYALALFREAVE